MCDPLVSRIAFYTFLVAGGLGPVVAMVGAKRWPQHTTRVALVSLGLFMVAAVAAAIVALC